MRLATRICRNYTKEELMKSCSNSTNEVSKSKLYMQSAVFYGNENALTLLPVKATYGFKKDYVALAKPGYLLVDIIPIEKNPIGEAKEV